MLSRTLYPPPGVRVDVVRTNPIDVYDALDGTVDPPIPIDHEAGHKSPAFGDSDEGPTLLTSPFAVEDLGGLLVNAEEELRRQELREPRPDLAVGDHLGAVNSTRVDEHGELPDGFRELDEDRLAAVTFALSLVDFLLLVI